MTAAPFLHAARRPEHSVLPSSSSSICVASRCAWVGPLGAVSTQNITDPALGPAGLALLRQGLGGGAVLNLLLAGTPDPDYRQVGVIDRYGKAALHSWARKNCRWLLTQKARPALHSAIFWLGPNVPTRMVEAYIAASGESPG